MEMSLYDKYRVRLEKAASLSDMNNIIEEAANDDRLMNWEYEELYTDALILVAVGD